ncbi:MAG: hypothetical protein IJE84_00160, partial [Clostridia bacterium]|nr:hypothetical protein [Clostridia bacterium]
MKKKLIGILALALCVLCAVPFAMFTSADTVPAKPAATANSNILYVAYDRTAASDALKNAGEISSAAIAKAQDDYGATADKPYKTSAGSAVEALFAEGGKLANGGRIVINGKFLISPSANAPYNHNLNLAATTAPVVISSSDGTTKFASTLPADSTAPVYTDSTAIYTFDEAKVGEYNLWDGKGKASAGQYGMLMMNTGKTLTIKGVVIFDDLVILNRQNAEQTEIAAGIFNVEGTLVVNSNVDFVEMSGNVKYPLNV